MQRFSLSALLVMLPAAALAMQLSDAPPKFPIPWANSAGSSYVRSIPTLSQIGVQNCAASLTDGFPPLTFVPVAAGGCPPFGQDFNGILKQLSQASRWGQAGGPIFFDSGFATSIGGYPSGATLSSAVVPGNQWMSTADNNTTDPDAGGANWVQAPGQVPTGTPVASFDTVAMPGYVISNNLTIGDASSAATGRANADTKFLFAKIWTWCPNVICQMYTSGGTPTSRGADAASDFAAHKALSTPNMKGLGLMGVDTMGGAPSTFLSGVPIQLGSTTSPGSYLGENLHALTAGENGTHAHANTLTDPGHAHSVAISDPGHLHANTLSDPGHVHAVNVTDPGHTHSNIISQAQFAISSGGVGPFLYGASIGGGAGALINSNTTGITASAASHTTGVTVNNASAATGISAGANSNVTGIGINNANSGSGTGHNTVQRGILVYWNLKL